MNKTTLRIASALILGVLAIGLVQMSFVTEIRPVQPALAAVLDETDKVDVAEVELDDVDYIIEEASKTKTLRQGHLSKVRIIATTADYHIKEFPEFYDAVHLAKDPAFLQEFWQLRKLGFTAKELMTGAGNLQFQKTLAQVDAQTGYQFQVQTKFTKFATANDSADGTGEVMKEEETYSIDDLAATTTSGELSLNSSDYTSWGTLESQYQTYADIINSNTSATDLYADADEEVDRVTLVSGFLDFQEAMKEVLRSNIAANESTSADTITPDRVTILDYTLNTSTQYEYISSALANEMRDAVEEYESGTTAALFSVKLFGFELISYQETVPYSFFDAQPVRGAVSSTYRNIFGRRMHLAKTVVSRKLASFSELSDLKDKYVKTISGGITKAQSASKGIIQASLKRPGDIMYRTVEGTSKPYVARTQRTTTKLVNSTGKMTSSPFTSLLGGLAKSAIIGIAVWLLAAGISLLFGIAFLFVIVKYVILPRTGAAPK